MRQLLILTLLFLSVIPSSLSQQPDKLNSAEIYETIKKLNFLGKVLYIAAHPDDENTRLISYLSKHTHAQTAYLSLTRGDGGQNLIGPEIRELLGVIRTQELLAARRIDGGTQLFTRANDFGYSKHPDETLDIWNKNKVLSDVVWAIRTFKPDIIINRFNHETAGSTHGHHTASAMLGIEAFDLANNPNQFPEQLEHTSLWQPRRLLFNTSWWFYGSQEDFENADKTNLLGFDVGTYFTSYGLSNTEIAALSRSQHKSQGFGSSGSRGTQTEYLELIKGDLPKDKTSLFDGIDTTWNRIEGGAAIGEILSVVQRDFDFTNPALSIPKLIAAYKLLKNGSDSYWKETKLAELQAIIEHCAGLFTEAVAETSKATFNSVIPISLEAINRSGTAITLNAVEFSDGSIIQSNTALKKNERYTYKSNFTILPEFGYSTPYWLDKPGTLGMYSVEDQLLIGKAETPKTTLANFNLTIEGEPFTITRPIVYKTTDPVNGEIYNPFDIVPDVSVNLSEDVFVFNSNSPKTITVNVTAYNDNISGHVELQLPSGWTSLPDKKDVSFSLKGEEKQLQFSISPPQTESTGLIKPQFVTGNSKFTKKLISLDYEHIPTQTIITPSTGKLVRLDIKKHGSHIGYIEGAGDVVPKSLEQIGYQVSLINPEDITADLLRNFDAVVVGIRAYNTIEAMIHKQSILFDYVKNGGNLIVQYNTSRDLKVTELAPYPLTLSRDRVTDENAEVRFLAPEHRVLNYPNKITALDFEEWTQERGLYFPDQWGNEFTAILSMNDKGESPKDGSLLVAKHGKGFYVYTGLSFFREFPEGVPGAFKLFTNLLSLNDQQNSN